MVTVTVREIMPDDINSFFEQMKAAEKEYIRRAATDFELFLRGLWVPVNGEKRLFGEVISDFQLSCFRELRESLIALKVGTIPKRGRYWLERTKGASKDHDLGLCLLWLLAFPIRPLYLQVGAADKDQAAIVKRRMEDVMHYNPWLGDLVDLQQNKAYNLPGQFVRLDILAADIAGSHGETPDLLIINELSHVTKWEFVENLLDNADKVPGGVVVIATNAGFKGTKVEILRNNAINSKKKWTVRLWQQPAPWISKSNIEDARRRNLLSRFNRLWYGKWASGKGDAISEEDIDRCLRCHKGPMAGPERGWVFVGGLDLGVSHDHAAFVVLGTHPIEGRIRLAWMKFWKPDQTRQDKQIDLIDVEETVLKMQTHYNLQSVSFDPTEGRLMAQQLRRRNVRMIEMSFASAKNLTVMAASLVQVISGRRIDTQTRQRGAKQSQEKKSILAEATVEDGTVLEAYDDEDGSLRRDMGKLNIVEKAYGYKLEAVSDESGHADIAIALTIALPRAIDFLSGRIGLQKDDILGEEEGASDEFDIADMPAELREIYEDSGG